MTFPGVKPISIAEIPKNTKLTPIRMDTNPELIIGQIIKINPKIMDNIPDALLASIFFSSKFCYAHFSSEQYENLKSLMLFILKIIFYILFNICYKIGGYFIFSSMS